MFENPYEFAITVQNEASSQAMLQLVRPKEGELVNGEFFGSYYNFEGSKILYLSDLHLDHIVADSKCKNMEEVISVLERVGQELERSYREYANEFTDGNVIVIIDGDLCHSPELFKMFSSICSRMYFGFWNKAFIILGNHELWAFPGFTIEEIVMKYKNISTVPILHNEIIVFEDKIIDNARTMQGKFCYCNNRLSYDTVMGMPLDMLVEKMRSARVIVLAGIGFSGKNEEFNANNHIYFNTLSREEEIAESKKFELLYNRFIEATKELKDRVFVVATHMPLQNWCSKPIHEDGVIYISGHTHRNYFYDDGIKRIYADNQNGYHRRHPFFKCVYSDDMYDPFGKYTNGIYEITKIEYILFYRAQKISMRLNRDYQTLYMLKKNGYYCFLARLANGSLSVLNGGRGSSFGVKDINYFYENMDIMIDQVSHPLNQYTDVQKQISSAIKAIGGTGLIHGCIVDFDFCNHIYLDPVDLTTICYYATDVIKKVKYDSIPNLLKERLPEVYMNYQHMLVSENANALMSIAPNQMTFSQHGTEFLEMDIYNASRAVSKMQKLENKILSYWNNSLLDAENQYIEASKEDNRPKLRERTNKQAGKERKSNTKASKETKTKRNKYIGMTKVMNCGLSATVIDYQNCNNLTIQFEDGIVKHGVRADHFMEGKVLHRLRPNNMG